MFYLTIYKHIHDGDYEKEFFCSESPERLLTHAMNVQPVESEAQETTEWHLSNIMDDTLEDLDDMKKL